MVRRLTVITGPPGCGKSTYLRDHAKPGDVVIDFDVLAQAFGSPDGHNHAEPFIAVAHAAWTAAVEVAVGIPPTARVWIIDARPRPTRLAAYRRNHARFVELGVFEDEA